MEETHLYVVVDRLAEETGPVFTARNDQVAARVVMHMLAEQEVDLKLYELYHVARYTPAHGIIPVLNSDIHQVILEVQ